MCSTVSLFFSKEALPAKADVLSPTTIGTFFTYSRVSENTKVIVSGTSKTIAEQAGKTIHMELIPVDPPFGPGILGGNLPDEPNLTRVQYYYIATPSDGIVHNKYTLYNTLDSLTIILNQLKADSIFLNQLDNNKLLGYLRSISTRYVDSSSSTFHPYNIVCGPIDTSFISSINAVTPSNGLRIIDYLASFVGSSVFNSSFHGLVSSQYLGTCQGLIDPLLGYHFIDLIHEFASIDGIAEDTGETTQSYSYVGDKNYFRAMVSWGGDLEQVACYGSTNTVAEGQTAIDYLPSFEYILNNPYYRMPWDDFYADIDAINMAKGFHLNGSTCIIDHFLAYYANLQSEYSRYAMFETNVIDMTDITGFNTDRDIMCWSAFRLLAMDYDGTTAYDIYDGDLYWVIAPEKWKYLTASDQPNIPASNSRLSLGYKFVNWIETFVY